MDWIFCISFAVLTSTTQSLRKSSWKLGPDLASSAELAQIGSNLKTSRNMAVDMDYFGGSSERLQRTSDEISAGRSEIEPPRINSVERGNPVIVYVVDSNMPKESQDKLMKVRSAQSSSSESDDGVTYEDLLKFLIQVGARLKEKQGTNPLSDQPNLIDLIRNTRRRYDDIYETDNDKVTPDKHEIISEENKVPSRPHIRKKELSAEKYIPEEKTRSKLVSREEPPRKKKRIISMEEPPRSVSKRGRARIPKHEPMGLKDLFHTAKPILGKKGIYVEN